MLKSRYSFIGYYFPLSIFTLLFMLPVLLFLGSKTLHHDGNNKFTDFGIIILIFVLAWDYFILNIKRLTIQPEGLVIRRLFRKQVVAWGAIEKIDLMITGTVFLTNYESTIIKLKTGKTICFSVFLYRNMRNLRIVLSRAVDLMAEKKDITSYLDFSIPDKIRCEEATNEEDGQRFSDSFIISLNGFLFFGFALLMLFIVYILIKDGITLPGLITLGYFIPLLYILFGRQSYYFIINDRQLIIKSHLLFWYKKVYDLDIIKDIKIEHIDRQAINLRVTTTDFQTRPFCASSLRSKTWTALADRFREMNIHVRKEA